MKASELMQGNIVRYEYDGRKFPARVVETYRNSVLVESINGEYEPIEIDECKIFPVPLTPEILEKNGFKKCEGNEWSLYKKDGEKGLYNILWSADELYLEIASYTSLAGEFNRMGIKYIHQLQQALRLCGIEKEIEL